MFLKTSLIKGLIPGLLIFVLPLSLAKAALPERLQITDNSFLDYSVQISGDTIAWSSFNGSKGGIFIFDGSRVSSLTGYIYNDVAALDVDGSKVVWSARINYADPYRIYWFDGVRVVQLSSAAADGAFSPAIDNGQVAWLEPGGLGFFDGATTKHLQVWGAREGPKISGGEVIWNASGRLYRYKDGEVQDFLRVIGLSLNLGVYSYDIDDGQIVFSALVYRDGWDPKYEEVFLYDGTQLIRLTDNDYADGFPVVRDGKVVWYGFDGHDYEIFLYDGFITKQISNNETHDGIPAIYQNYLVWQGDNNSPKVFFYDGQKISLISGGAAYSPKIDNNKIVWLEWDGNDYEVILYRLPLWLPQEFWSEVQNASTGRLKLRQNFGINESVIKTVPNGWVLKVLSTSNESGNNVEQDNYRWYEVEDVTDGAIGWIPAVSLVEGITYLDYNPAAQSLLERKTSAQLNISDERIAVVLEATDRYYQNIDTTNSLYGTSGGRDGNDNFQSFISGAIFPKELILAIAAQESGPEFNNERCSFALDGGIGVMQITSPDFKGMGSGLDNYLKKSDCDTRTGWVGTVSQYYSNVHQGIYANIKDGFRVLQEKYRKKCPKESIVIHGIEFSCTDIEKILTVWGYNGFGKDTTGEFTGNYLKEIAEKLEHLSDYFVGIVYPNDDQLVEKLRLAHSNKRVVRLFSPGELQVYDVRSNVTGLIDGQAKEEIPNSLYDTEQEAAVLFFPDEAGYRVVGSDQGTYGLSVESTEDGDLAIFAAINIPITAQAVHQYTIDWEALSRGEKGATVQVDQNGDGVFDYQFQAPSTLHDTEKPETQVQLLGASGSNDWYTSNVQVVLSAQDNEGGVGILKTEFSLDSGLTWSMYGSPLTVSIEGTNVLLYRSQDFLGNLENTKIVEVKIDKISPEVVIYFEEDSRTLRVEGADNLGNATVTRQGEVYFIRDEAGNTTRLPFSRFEQHGTAVSAQLDRLYYNGQLIRLPRTNLKYEFSLDKKINAIRELEQTISAYGQFDIKAKYSHRDDATEVKVKDFSKGEKKIKLRGLVVVKLRTYVGKLTIDYSTY